MLAAVLADNFTDPAHERLIWLAAGGLIVLGVGLAVLTWFWWRGTKGEHAALAPLEVMGDRSWSKLTHVEQTRRLEGVRLRGEGDVEPVPAAADAVDLDEALRSFQPGFDDLRDEPAPAVANDAEADEVAEVGADDNVIGADDVHAAAPPTADEPEPAVAEPVEVEPAVAEAEPSEPVEGAADGEVSPTDSPRAATPVEADRVGTVSPAAQPEPEAGVSDTVDGRPKVRNGDVRVDPLLESETVDG